MEPAGQDFDQEHRKWIAYNLMNGCGRDELKSILIGNGVPEGIAEREVHDAETSPYVRAGIAIKHDLNKRESLLTTLDYQRRHVKNYLKVEKIDLPPFEQFLQEYYYENKVGLFKNGINHWKALEWTMPGLVEKVGADTEVNVQFNRESDPKYEEESHKHRANMPFGEFIGMIESTESSNNFYMTANNEAFANSRLARLVEDTGNVGDGYLHPKKIGKQTHLWIGPKGTVTPLHHDLTNNLFIQITGRKVFRMIPSMQVQYMYNLSHVYSSVDMLNPDYGQFPNFRNVTPVEVEVGPGNILFIPIGWWHHVVSLSKNISLSFTNFNLPDNTFYGYPEGNRY